MALPVPIIVTDQTTTTRTKFAQDGLSFAKFVSTWPDALPPDTPDTMDSGAANDRYREGDEGAVTHILYRVIENRAMTDMLTRLATRSGMRSWLTRRSAHPVSSSAYLTTTYYYQDVVYAAHRGRAPRAGHAGADRNRCDHSMLLGHSLVGRR